MSEPSVRAPHLRLATVSGQILHGLNPPQERPKRRRSREPVSSLLGPSSLIAGTAERLPPLFARFKRAVDEGDHLIVRALANEIGVEIGFLAAQTRNLHARLAPR